MSGIAKVIDDPIVVAGGISNMTDREFSLFSTLIYGRFGIKMPYSKKLMLTSRLIKRLRVHGMTTYMEYYEYLSTEKGQREEFSRMVDAVTTNKTDFFREADHFNVLVNKVLPDLARMDRIDERKTLNIWSAGCSTGEEAYTIAMVMSEYFSGFSGGFNITGTDISSRVLKAGAEAVYTEGAIEPIPYELRKKYLLRGKGDKQGLYKIVPQLRERVTFRRLNLMDESFDMPNDMDIVFCRNVIIYFDKETQVKLFRKFYNHILPGGYLFIGSSETLYGVNSDFIPAGPTVYRKPGKSA